MDRAEVTALKMFDNYYFFFITFKGIPGSFICYYYGYAKKKCNGTPLEISDLPPECSSFVIDGIIIDRSIVTHNYTKHLKLTGIYEGMLYSYFT